MSGDTHQRMLERLIDLLDRVVREQVGDPLADAMQRLRRLALERRAGLPDAEARLTAELQRLSDEELRATIRGLSLYFDLANLTEDLQRIRVLRKRGLLADRKGVPRPESIAEAVHQLRQQGCTATDMQAWLHRLQIEPVFTAHPSEAKRRTTRELLRRIRRTLPRLLGTANEEAEQSLLADLTVLWQSDLVRPDRPPVMSEVSRGLFFSSTLWDVVPKIYRELRDAVSQAYPHHQFDVPRFLSFGSWIGGDRDGHPFVTPEITKRTLSRLRRAAVENHLGHCREMLKRIVMSDQQVPSDPSLKATLNDWSDRSPDLAPRLQSLSPLETYRRYLKLIEYRLEATLADRPGDKDNPARYPSADEFRADLEALRQSIVRHRGQRVAAQIVQPWIDLVDTFGFHFTALDVRQNSASHRECLLEILAQQPQGVVDPTDEQLQELLSSESFPQPINLDALTPSSRDVYETFLLLAAEVRRWGTRPLGGYIISMTHAAQDVLMVHGLWRSAWCSEDPEGTLPLLPIIPLFETIHDLQHAPEIMADLFENPTYAAYLNTQNRRHQIVMIGYSDSTKDGGYLSACWELHQAQKRLAEVAHQHNTELTIFHGRGGALGRGGGPAARAIRSLPPLAVGGRLRVTEQGEILAERYDDPRIAHRHLEQLINATLWVSARADILTNPDWVSAMTLMSEASFRKYRDFVDHPAFLAYFNAATPIGEIETLPIGSRPARRSQRASLADLRAIPWTFAWTQSRHMLPAWYGFGTAIRTFVDTREDDWSLLRNMYADWPMFRALVDNAELALAKADIEIAHTYAKLLDDPSGSEIYNLILEEFNRSRGGILLITGQNELLSATSWLSRSIQNRNPYVDPLNLAQIDLLRRKRSVGEEPQLQGLLRLTIQGIASGLRTTG